MKKHGLKKEEVSKSLEKHGSNYLSEYKKESFVIKFISNLGDPMIKILCVALAINIIFTFTGYAELIESIIDRKDKNGGNGLGVREDISYTLNTADRHAVWTHNQVTIFDNYSFGGYRQCEVAGTITTGKSGLGCGGENLVCKKEIKTFSPQTTSVGYKESIVANTQTKGQHKNPTDLALKNNIVRRLTPLECSRLQGFPDNWLDDIEINVPTEQDLIFWNKVFEEHRKINKPNSKPKTENQIRKWLKNPRSDSAEYKMWTIQ
ncbi:MAG: cation-transporting P-type ATPase [Defluviitaleaceae bacterium]|nr:cation-transporting P-type ATPase [Defluviitaleaceae bacterium]